MKATMDAMIFYHAFGSNEHGGIFKPKQDIYTQTPKGKNHMTLFPFTLNYIKAYFLKSVIQLLKYLKL